MVSEVRFNQIFNYWWEDLKWSGVFDINWVYLKDVHHAEVKQISYDNTPIPHLKDGTEIDFNSGCQLLEIFKNKLAFSDIFEAFKFMDEREKILRVKRDCYYQLFIKLNEHGLIEPDKNQKNENPKTNIQFPNKNQKNDGKGNRKNMRNSEVYYEKKSNS